MTTASQAHGYHDPGPAPPHGFRPEIQGLRAIAVLAVLAFHLWPGSLPGGYVGVDVFFVISGFLITGLLLRQAEGTGRIGIVDFYTKRIKRLLPAATLVLAAVAVGISLLPVIRWSDTAAEIAASALYFQNWWLAASAVDYLAADNQPSALLHYWSLSVEEQYYIAWPLLFAVLGWLSRGCWSVRQTFGVIVVGVGLLSFGYSVWLTPRDPGLAYFATTTRAWELALGGALAVYSTWERWPEHVRRFAGFAGLAMVAWACLRYDVGTPFPGYQALLPTVGAALLITSGASASQLSAYRLLRSRPMQYLGDLSYSLYLWHWPAIVFYREIAGRELGLVDGVVVAAVSLALAHQTKVLVEDVFRAPGVIQRPRWKPFAFAGACIGLALCSWFAINKQVVRYEAASAAAGPTGPEAVNRHGLAADALIGVQPSLGVVRKDVPKAYAAKCHVGLVADEPVACHVGTASGPAVFVIGDSHAAQWLPAYESLVGRLQWNVDSYTKSACLFADVEVVGGRSGGKYESCTRWNQALMEIIRERKPYAVIVSQSRAYKVVGKDSVDSSYPQVANALAQRWRTLQSLGVRVMVLADTPRSGMDVPECLAKSKATIEGCSRTLKQATKRADPLYLAAESAGVPVVDMNDRLCPDDMCLPVVDDILVWRDSHHISATFADHLGPILAERVAAELEQPL